MNNKIVIAGGNGFIGQYLAEWLSDAGYDVTIIARSSNPKSKQKIILWQNTNEIITSLENALLLINLAGKSVNCRYNKKNKEEIVSSRVGTTHLLGEAVLKCNIPPQVWMNMSTATIYRHAEDRTMTETEGEIGTGFSVNVAKKWEEAFFSYQLPKTRQVALRTAIVLGANGGALKPLENLVRYGLGGKQGNGKQMFSWIHIDDFLNSILFILNNPKLNGVYNCSSPNPVSNEVFMQTLRKVMTVKIGLPAPKWLLEIGAVFMGTETELILKSRWVIPEKLIAAGYSFKHPILEEALNDLLKRK